MRVAAGAIAKKYLAGLGIQVRGYMIVRPSVEENIMGALLAEGPLTIAVNANPITFQVYREGK